MKNKANKTYLAVILFIVLIFTMSPFHSLAASSNTQAPKLVSGSITPRVIAYQGNAVPGYLTAVINTDEPSRGYIDVIGSVRSTKIELAPWTDEYETTHEVNWVPWDEDKKQPLPPGDYSLKLNLNDKALNKTAAIDLGKITVVSEPNPKPLIENVTISPAIVSPTHASSSSVATIRFTLNRHAVVDTLLRREGNRAYIGSDYFHSGRQTLAPGIHEIVWDGKDDNGMIVPGGIYYVMFKAYELNYNHPTGYPQEYWPNTKLTVKDSESGIPKGRLKQILTHAEFSRPVISPDGDGIQDTVQGKITLAEGVTNLAVYISDSMGYNVCNPLLTEKNAKPGTYSFTWDGKNFRGDSLYNGTYYINVNISQDGRYFSSLRMENASVLLTDGIRINAPQPAQKVRVSTDSVLISVDPTGSGYIAVNGEVFTVLDYEPGSTEPRGAYKVLIKDGITAHIPAAYVEMIDLDTIPARWGNTVKDNVAVRKGPTEDYEMIEKLAAGTKLRILREDGDFYRVLLSTGNQAFIAMTDLKPEGKGTGSDISIKDIDSSSDFARQSIINLAGRNIISGNENGYFNPRRTVSRSEMIKMLVNALNIDTGNIPENPTYKDVPKNHWAYKYVEAASREGIVKGISSDLFGVDETCTREEMAAMFVRSLGISDDNLTGKLELDHVNSLQDKNKISAWAKNYVEFALSSGLMKGSGSKAFDAKGHAERQQAAVVTDRFMESRNDILKLAELYRK